MYIRGVAQASNSLESVRIKIEDWELDKTITMKSDDIKTYDVDYKFMAPDDVDSEKNAEINVMVTDKAGLQTQYQFLQVLLAIALLQKYLPTRIFAYSCQSFMRWSQRGRLLILIWSLMLWMKNA